MRISAPVKAAIGAFIITTALFFYLSFILQLLIL